MLNLTSSYQRNINTNYNYIMDMGKVPKLMSLSHSFRDCDLTSLVLLPISILSVSDLTGNEPFYLISNGPRKLNPHDCNSNINNRIGDLLIDPSSSNKVIA